MTRAKDISKIVTDADLSGTLDVTGAVTAGGLTMDTGGNSTHTLEFGANRTSDSQALGIIRGSWNSTVVSQINLSAGDDTTNKDNGQIFFRTAEAGTTANRLRIEENGDISFYEDTGTTPKLFWDASAESLGIGTSSPYTLLELSSTDPILRFNDSNGGTDTKNFEIRYVGTSSPDIDGLYFRTVNDANSVYSDKMVVLGSGNVGIGTSSPLSTLVVGGNANTTAKPTVAITDTTSGATLSMRGQSPKIAFDVTSSGVPKILMDNAGLEFKTGTLDAEGDVDVKIDSSGNVGIGISSPVSALNIQTTKTVALSSADHFLTLGLTIDDSTAFGTAGGGGGIAFRSSRNSGGVQTVYSAIDGAKEATSGDSFAGSLRFYTNQNATGVPLERMRITSGGNLLVGTTTNGTAADGTVIRADGENLMTRLGQPLTLNRRGDHGTVIEIRKDNSAVGFIGTFNGDPYIARQSGNGMRWFSGGIHPCTVTGATADNAVDLGNSSGRFDDVFATNGTIQTSDRNEKQDIEELSDAEQRVAVVAKGLMRKFRWIDSVAEKGDNARTHFGIIAQDLQDAFTAEGLDASKYAMFTSNTWWEKEISVDAVEADEENGIEAKDAYTYIDTKDEATEGYTEKTRLGVRYNQLLAFIISAI